MDDLIARLAAIGTTSLCDAAPDAAVLTGLRPLSAGCRLAGPARTIDSAGDLVPVLRGLDAARSGDVLVVATGGAAHAVAGELFAAEAARRGVVGLVVDGAVRDAASLRDARLAVWARGTCPRAGAAVSAGGVDVPVRVAGVPVASGDLLIADDDGIVVLPEADARAAVARAEAIEAGERRILRALRAGTSLFDLSNAGEHLHAVAGGAASRLELRPPAT